MSQAISQSATLLSHTGIGDSSEALTGAISAYVQAYATKAIGEHGSAVYSNHRGKQSLYAIICRNVREVRGLGENMLPAEVAAEVKKAIGVFFDTKLEQVKAGYDRMTVKTGGLVTKFKKGKIDYREAFATARFSRLVDSEKEKSLADFLTLNATEVALNREMDKPGGGDATKKTKLNAKIAELRASRARFAETGKCDLEVVEVKE